MLVGQCDILWDTLLPSIWQKEKKMIGGKRQFQTSLKVTNWQWLDS